MKVASCSWVSGAYCVASCVHDYHSVWVTDAWRMLQAICHQHDSGLLQCAFINAVGGIGRFALPSICLSYRMETRHCISPVKIIILTL